MLVLLLKKWLERRLHAISGVKKLTSQVFRGKACKNRQEKKEEKSQAKDEERRYVNRQRA
jgi:hypothetical protein